MKIDFRWIKGSFCNLFRIYEIFKFALIEYFTNSITAILTFPFQYYFFRNNKNIIVFEFYNKISKHR